MYLKFGVLIGGAADPVHAVVAIGGGGQGGVPLANITTVTQSHLANQQQPRAIRFTPLRVLHTGAAGRGGVEMRMRRERMVGRIGEDAEKEEEGRRGRGERKKEGEVDGGR